MVEERSAAEARLPARRGNRFRRNRLLAGEDRISVLKELLPARALFFLDC
jgi:hypothetical protein